VLQEMKIPRVSAYGFLIAVGMLAYFGVAVGLFQHLHFVAVIVWIPILVLIGVLVRRRFLPYSTDSLAAVGFGLLLSSLVVVGLGIFTGSDDGSVTLWNKVQAIAMLYGLWFWLPFVAGITLGGFRTKEEAEQDAALKQQE
ncbi:MAG: hypothetical protein AB8D78_07400, partial [Akkermansiaceae bacterium]